MNLVFFLIGIMYFELFLFVYVLSVMYFFIRSLVNILYVFDGDRFLMALDINSILGGKVGFLLVFSRCLYFVVFNLFFYVTRI